MFCVEEGFVNGPHLLGEVHKGSYYLTSVKLKGRRNCLRMMRNEEEDEGDGEVKDVRENAHFMHGRDETNTRTFLSHAMCAKNECDSKDRTRTKKTNTTRTFTCSCCASC